jgi:S-adenosylmethionine:tRNA ribosyltransferase-isomerase
VTGENHPADGDGLLAQFDYELPPDLIAQEPARPRDASRLMVLDRRSGAIAHRWFHELPELLGPRDLLVLNDTRVIPAAFTARRATGARIEGIFLRALDGGLWEVLLAGRGRLKMGETLSLVDPREAEPLRGGSGDPPRPRGGDVRGGSFATASLRPDPPGVCLVCRGEGAVWHVRPPAGVEPAELLGRIGRPPLPPYIRRKGEADDRAAADRNDYQTIYARRDGAVAAPTAGLHFTPRVIEGLDARGIERVFVTLHVGLGTFQPVRAERLADHRMHEEHAHVSPEAAERINRARAEGRRIVAVGTTTVRALESAAGEQGVRAGSRWTRLFIRPPHRFRVVDAMLTNFHLPRTTLLVMVSAFAGRERILAAYREAIRAGYRFYSYGDAMLIV